MLCQSLWGWWLLVPFVFSFFVCLLRDLGAYTNSHGFAAEGGGWHRQSLIASDVYQKIALLVLREHYEQLSPMCA